MSPSRWRLLVAAVGAAVVPVAAPAAAASCTPGAYVTSAQYGSTKWRTATFLPKSAPPDLFVQHRGAGQVSAERLRGTSGRRVWGPVSSGGQFSGVLMDHSDNTILELVDGGGCGSVVVRKLSSRTGRPLWARRLAGVATPDRPHVDVRSPGLADFTGDGVADMAVLRAAQEGVGIYSRCIEQPSESCRIPGASWSSRLDVLDGRTGRVVAASDLGSGRMALPTAAWVRRGGAYALAVTVPSDAVATDVALYTPRARPWRTNVATGAADVALLAGASTLVAVVSTAAFGELSTGSTVTAFDSATGLTRWSTPPSTAATAVVLRNGDVVVTEVAAGRVRRVGAASGADIWSIAAFGPTRLNPYSVQDVDGRGLEDVAVPLPDRTVVVAGEDGTQLAAISGMPNLMGTADLTGDRIRDLLVLADPQAASPTVVLRRGRDLREVWRTTVPLSSERTNGVEVEGAGGRAGSVLVHSMYGKRFVLSAATGAVRWSMPADST